MNTDLLTLSQHQLEDCRMSSKMFFQGRMEVQLGEWIYSDKLCFLP